MFKNINFDVKDIIIYYVIVIEVIYCLSLSIQYNIIKHLNIIKKCKIIYPCLFPSKDYVFTPGTSLYFEIPHWLAPIGLQNGGKYQRDEGNVRIKFSLVLWNYLFSFYFCHYDDVI